MNKGLKILTEVGIELELFLMKDAKVIEPSLFGFPADEMGFLIELRSWHSDKPELIQESIDLLYAYSNIKANTLGMTIERVANKELDLFFVDYLWGKYRYDEMPDYTRNIHFPNGGHESHHVGLKGGNTATAGMHVHFSKRAVREDGLVARVLPLDMTEIVRRMDKEFRRVVEGANRHLGEYEPKKHGFEYRSLPATADIPTVLDVAFKILDEVE